MKKSAFQSLEDRFEHAERISQICNWECDPAFESWNYASSNTENIIGIPADEMLGPNSAYLRHLHPDDRDRVEKIYQTVADSKRAYEVEYRFSRPDGRAIILHEFGEPIPGDDGTLLGFMGTTQDVTLLRKAEEEARRNLERFNYAEEIAGITHWEADAGFNVQIYVSENTERLYGIPAEKLVGDFSNFTDSLDPDDKEPVAQMYASIRSKPRFYHLKYRFIRNDGRMIYVSETGKPIRSDDGVVIGFRGTTQDITNIKLAVQELEKSNAYAGAIVETAVDAIITIDSMGIVETINTATEKMFGYAADDIIGENIKILMPPYDAGRHDDYITSYLQTGTAQIIGIGREVVGKRKDGQEFPIKLSISEMRFGNKRSFAGVVRDITESKNHEAQLLEALSRAEDANRAKTDFLSSMSHELRTPLNAIIGFSATIKEEMFGPIGNAKYLEYMSDINSSGTHLLALINEILDISAIESGRLELSEEIVNLRLAADTAMRLVRERSEVAKIKLSNTIETDSPRLFADARRIQQIFLNLLSNAVKFTPRGGQVDVSAVHEDDGGVTLRISDTGIGMDAPGLAKAMMKFGQVDSGLARKHEGTGLGLPLTERLVELHGGTFDIASEPGKGTVVSVGFPADRVRDH